MSEDGCAGLSKVYRHVQSLQRPFVANLLPSIRSWMMVTGASTYDAPPIR